MTTALKTPHIAFLGAGNMASAIAQGLHTSKSTRYSFSVADPYEPALIRWRKEFSASALGAYPDAIVLAVKPQQFTEAALSLNGLLAPSTLVISIMAGIPIARISAALQGHATIVRTMPNTPARIGQAITGMFATAACTKAQTTLAAEVMSSIGQTVFVAAETQLDAVTAVSGSGPAYVFYIAQAMTQAGVNLGLPLATARHLALATLQGAAALAQDSGEDLDVLREQVTSKGGTTHAAMNVLQNKQVAQAFHEALAAADARAKELGSM